METSIFHLIFFLKPLIVKGSWVKFEGLFLGFKRDMWYTEDRLKAKNGL